MRVVGIDLGAARTGLAISDEQGIVARPLRTVATERLPEELKTLQAEGPVRFVVGRPRSLDGGLGPQAAWVDQEIEKLKLAVPGSYEYEDETGTTAESSAAGDSTDAGAARVILQGYLDGRS